MSPKVTVGRLMSNALFDGMAGAMVAQIMAKANAEAEAEAIALLDPAPGAAILVIGFGPGVGVELLAKRPGAGRCVGVDPSGAMLREAARRCARHIADGRVALQQATADKVACEDATFDGAIAVNSLQLCEPFTATATELARVLRPGARLVSLTHDWAARKHAGSVEAWVAQVTAALVGAGFTAIENGPGQADKGKILRLTAVRR